VVSGNQLQLSKAVFEKSNDEKISYRKYIITHVENLDYPIVIYRNNADDYTALLLRCTHQGNEVSVSGDLLSCSAHGSEFDRTGAVIQGPAEKNLVSYRVTSDEKNIYVQLS